MRPHAFGPGARLSSRRDFGRVFQDGRKLVGRRLILWHRASPGAAGARLGLAVGAKVGGAVRRSRVKRLLRETFRLNRGRLAGGDFVAYPRPGCRWRTRAEAEADFLELCRKAGTLL